MMPFHFLLQELASTPGPVILINSVLVGAFAGILSAGVFSVQLVPAVGIASISLAVAFFLHRHFGDRVWRRHTREGAEVRFPPPPS